MAATPSNRNLNQFMSIESFHDLRFARFKPQIPSFEHFEKSFAFYFQLSFWNMASFWERWWIRVRSSDDTFERIPERGPLRAISATKPLRSRTTCGFTGGSIPERSRINALCVISGSPAKAGWIVTADAARREDSRKGTMTIPGHSAEGYVLSEILGMRGCCPYVNSHVACGR